MKPLKFHWVWLLVAIGLFIPLNSLNREGIDAPPSATDFSSVRPMTCFELFYEDAPRAKITQAERRRNGWTQYGWIRTLEERVGPVRNGRMKVLYQYIFPMSNRADTQTAIITSLREREVPKGAYVPAAPNSQTLRRVADKALDFVIATYRDRRPHWTPKFLEKLRKVGIEYLEESTYITVQDRGGFSDGPLRGTLRLIKEKNGFLPMERYLGIEINSGEALKVEPGNFAIDKHYNAEAWPEIMMQLWSSGARELEPGRKNHYYTYADEFSLSLYSMLGFKPIPESELRLRPGVEMVNGKILVDGIWWTPMHASQETLDGLLDLHLGRLARRNRDTDEIETLIARREELKKVAERAQRSIRGHGFYNGVPVSGRITMSRAEDTIDLDLRLDPPNEVISVFGMLRGDALPLKEGPLRSTWVRDEKVSYHDGILKFESEGGFVTEIETTPDLGVVRRLRQSHSRHPTDVIELEF